VRKKFLKNWDENQSSYLNTFPGIITLCLLGRWTVASGTIWGTFIASKIVNLACSLWYHRRTLKDNPTAQWVWHLKAKDGSPVYVFSPKTVWIVCFRLKNSMTYRVSKVPSFCRLLQPHNSHAYVFGMQIGQSIWGNSQDYSKKSQFVLSTPSDVYLVSTLQILQQDQWEWGLGFSVCRSNKRDSRVTWDDR